MDRLEEMTGLLTDWKSCKKCNLAQTRNQIIFGDGALKDGTIMIVGQCPGGTEDDTGVSYTGVSGELILEMLLHLNLDRPDIAEYKVHKNGLMDFPGLRSALCSYYYFTNALKCHPPSNANPTKAQINACHDKLFAEIYVVDPTMIIALGKIAYQVLTGARKGIASGRGKLCFTKVPTRLKGWPPLQYRIMPCYHPSLLLRRADYRAKGHSKGTTETTFDDMKIAHKVADLYNNINYGMSIPDREK